MARRIIHSQATDGLSLGTSPMVAQFKEWLAYHQVTNPDAYTIRSIAARWAPNDTALFEVCEALIGPDWLLL